MLAGPRRFFPKALGPAIPPGTLPLRQLPRPPYAVQRGSAAGATRGMSIAGRDGLEDGASVKSPNLGEKLETWKLHGKYMEITPYPSTKYWEFDDIIDIISSHYGHYMLVGGLEHVLFSIIYGMSSFPLTNMF